MKYTIKINICQVSIVFLMFGFSPLAIAQKYEEARPNCCKISNTLSDFGYSYIMTSAEGCNRIGGNVVMIEKCIQLKPQIKNPAERPKQYVLDEAVYVKLRKNLLVSVSAFSRYVGQLDMNAPKLKGTDFEKTWQQLTAVTKAQKENFQDFRFFLISSSLGPEDRVEINNRLEAIKNNTLAIQAELRALEKQAQSKKGWLAIAAGKQGELELLEKSARANINRLDKEIIEMEEFKTGLYKLQVVPSLIDR